MAIDPRFDCSTDNDQYDQYDQYKKTNREKTKEPNSFRAWCLHCDRAKVEQGLKCPSCGNKTGKRKYKKTSLRNIC